MFALFNPPRSKKGRRRKKKFSFLTPGGGRIFSFNKGKTRRRRAAFSGGFNMARGRKRGRHVRRNAGLSSYMSMPRRSGGTLGLASLKPKAILHNLTGAVPILAGVVADGMFSRMLGSKIPYTGKGIGQVALGLAGAGLLRMVGNYANRALGEGLFIGGVVGTLGCAFQNFMREGIHSLALSDDLDGFSDVNANPYTQYSFQGMGQFVSPGQVQNAFSAGSAMPQYSLPNANAAYMPRAGLQPAQTPAQAAGARSMAEYEGAALAAVTGDDNGMSGIF